MTSDKPRLFLHIGMSRTGTTSIQAMLHESKDMLLNNHKILYPETGLVRRAHHKLADTLGFVDISKKVDENDFLSLQKSLMAEFNSTNANTVIMSSEYFCNVGNIDIVRQFFNNFDVSVILFLRHHVHWFESTYRQFSKFKNKSYISDGFESFYIDILRHEGVINYDKIITRWENVFGRQSLFIQAYDERARIDLKRFLSLVNVTMLEIPSKSKQLNTSPSRLACYLIEFAKSHNYYDYDSDKFILQITDIFKSNNDLPFISPSMSEIIALKYQSLYKRLVTLYGVNDDIQQLPSIESASSWYKFKIPSRDAANSHLNQIVLSLK